jgi:hypothetical protein
VVCLCECACVCVSVCCLRVHVNDATIISVRRSVHASLSSNVAADYKQQCHK